MGDYRETVHDLNDLAITTRLMSELSMITIYLLDDPNYSREDAARDLIGIINDLDTVSGCIFIDDIDTVQAIDEVAAEKECG